MTAIQRFDMAHAPQGVKPALSVSLGVRSVLHLIRPAFTCPSRKLPDDEHWEANPKCLAAAQRLIDGSPVLRSELTEWESTMLANIRLVDDPE